MAEKSYLWHTICLSVGVNPLLFTQVTTAEPETEAVQPNNLFFTQFRSLDFITEQDAMHIVE